MDKENIALMFSNTSFIQTNGQMASIMSNTSFASQNILASLNNTQTNINDSFDADKLKFDVYEKSIQKLSDENKALRNRVKKLTELARAKEEQLMDAFKEACESKRKSEEKNQIKHASELQSYYECFLHIENENTTLKTKMEQMRSKIIEQQSIIDEFNLKQQSAQQVDECLLDEAEPAVINDELNRMSMRHIDEELSILDKSVKAFIDESKLQKINETTTLTNQIANTNQDDMRECNRLLSDELNAKNERISELELEKEAINKKLTGIEASLARWIFRACDYKSDLAKSIEELDALKISCSNLETMSNELEEIKKEAKKDSDQLKLKLEEKINQINKIEQMFQNEKQINEALRQTIADLNKLMNKETTEAFTQTLNDPHTKFLVTNKGSGIVAQTAAKLNQLKGNDGLDFGSHNSSSSSSKAPANNQSSADIQLHLKRIETLSSDLAQVKAKLDAITLERNAFKFKNDELIRELDGAISKLSQPINIAPLKIFESKSIQANIKCAATTTNTAQQTHESSATTQNLSSEYIELLSRFDTLKKDFESLKIDSSKEISELRSKLNEKCKLEQSALKENKANEAKISDLNKSLNDLRMEKDLLDDKLAKFHLDYIKEKKISDTIIKQQKKLLDFLQNKCDTNQLESNSGHNLISLLNKKFKSSHNHNNPLLANLQKTTNQQYLNKQQKKLVKSPLKTTSTLPAIESAAVLPNNVKEIEAELNSNYVTYTELTKRNAVDSATSQLVAQSSNDNPSRKSAAATKQQIHVFVTGLNTCPTFCHVCQQLIPLIAYASKCQLCSFCCHAKCSSNSAPTSSSGKSAKQSFKRSNNLHLFDPLKYCHINYLTNGIEYNNYINKLVNFNSLNKATVPGLKSSNILLGDYLYINLDNNWKKLWLTLRLDQPQLDLYQKKANLKSFDSINLLNDRVMIETNIKQIKNIIKSSNACCQSILISQESPKSGNQDNIYEDINDNQSQSNLINFEQSNLIILLHNSKLCLQIGFTSFNKKNIWYDALQSSILLGQSLQLSKRSQTALYSSATTAAVAAGSNQNDLKCFNVSRVLKPFLELCDTVVNSYCFINENLIALACDDGLYALNSFVNEDNKNSNQEDNISNISLVKIQSIESAHKLYYQNEFGKLCFIGRRSRQFLSIDIDELNESLLNSAAHSNNDPSVSDDDDDDEDGAKSIRVKLEPIHNIDRCHLFECNVSCHGFNWYLAVATPETIFILLFNKTTNKYTLVKTIQTPNESPCLCIKFTNNELINQLIYGCGKEFYRLDLTYLQPSSMIDPQLKKNILEDLSLTSAAGQHQQQHQPIAICVIKNSMNEKQEALLLCYEEYGVFFVYNFNTMSWQQPYANSSIQMGKKSSTSSISNANLNNYIRWPRGNNLTPLQIEYDSSYLYLFYNDSIIVYKILFENEQLLVRKFGVAFVYKPRYLSTFHTTNANCLIISNRRPLDSSSAENEDQQAKDSNEYNDSQNSCDYSDCNEISSTSRNNPIIQDLNNKICLSYFSPDSN